MRRKLMERLRKDDRVKILCPFSEPLIVDDDDTQYNFPISTASEIFLNQTTPYPKKQPHSAHRTQLYLNELFVATYRPVFILQQGDPHTQPFEFIFMCHPENSNHKTKKLINTNKCDKTEKINLNKV